MMRFLMTLALAAVPMIAQAGVGSTYGFGGNTSGVGPGLPSLDFNNQGLVVQIHALDLIYHGANGSGSGDKGDLLLSANVFKTVQKGKVNEDIGGVVQAGGGLAISMPEFDSDFVAWDVQLKARLGAQTQKGAGFGIYVVPGLGATNGVTGDPSIAASGMVQFSAWMNK